MSDEFHTYDETLSTALSKVRFNVQDVRAPWIWTDAEVNYAISSSSTTAGATVFLCRRGLVKATNRAMSFSNEQGSVDYVSRVPLFQALIREFEKEDTASLPKAKFVYLGGTPSDLDYTS